MNFLKLKKSYIKRLLCIILLTIFCLFLRLYVFTLAYVPSESMYPTLHKGDLLFATKYDINNVNRYDIVLFDFPDNEQLCFVKRVIGLPGEKISIKDGQVYVNGKMCENNFVQELSNDNLEYIVPEGCYFMMGDNRNHSYDSRFWKNTFVRENQIKGKVKCIFFPFSRKKIF